MVFDAIANVFLIRTWPTKSEVHFLQVYNTIILKSYHTMYLVKHVIMEQLRL